jgi:hypothetical protein
MTGKTTAATGAMTGKTGVVAALGCSGNRSQTIKAATLPYGLAVLVRRGSDGVPGGPAGTGSRPERIDRDCPGGAGASVLG